MIQILTNLSSNVDNINFMIDFNKVRERDNAFDLIISSQIKINCAQLEKKMPPHKKKRYQNFDLTEAQREFLIKSLPKHYTLAPLVDIPQQKIEHEDNYCIQQEDNDHNISMMISARDQGKIKNSKKQFERKKQKINLKNSQQISNANISAKNNDIEGYEQSEQMLKKKPTLCQKKSKKTKELVFKDEENLKEIGKISDLENQIKITRQHTSKQRVREKQSESIRHSIQIQTLYQLTGAQKQFCFKLLHKLKSYKSSWPFRVPVDPITQGVPTYFQVIKEPMDLKTIQKKLNSNKYEHLAQFHADVNRIFLNSYKFNPRKTNYCRLTFDLEQYYHNLLKQAEKNPNFLEKTKKVNIKVELEQEFHDVKLKKKKSSKKIVQIQREYSEHNLRQKKYSVDERKQFAFRINELKGQQLNQVIDFIQNSQNQALEEYGDNYLINFEKLNDQFLDRLCKYFRNQEQSSQIQHTNSFIYR